MEYAKQGIRVNAVALGIVDTPMHKDSAANLPTTSRASRATVSGYQQVILNLLQNASHAMSAVDDRPRQLLIRTERDDRDLDWRAVQNVDRN